MSSLIKNEITKILKKKSLYIMLIVIFVFVIFSNAMYKYAYSSAVGGNYYNESYIKMLQEDTNKLNPEDPLQVDEYISNKTEIDTYEMLKNYDQDSWQYDVISNKGIDYLSQINYYTYKEKNNEELEKAKTEYNQFLERLNLGDWKSFACEELEIAKQTRDSLGENIKDSSIDLQIETLQMRLDYNIEYGNNFKNEALSRYSQSKMQVLQYEQNDNKTYNEKIEYQEAKEELEKSKYAIQKDKDIFNRADSRGILLNLFKEYELFIIITVILIAGAIVSEEFNKGTIKLLLVRPYSRAKILFAKYIVVLLTAIFIIAAIAVMQFIVGGAFFGFNSLSIPAIEYNHVTGTLEEVSIAKSILLTSLRKASYIYFIRNISFCFKHIIYKYISCNNNIYIRIYGI